MDLLNLNTEQLGSSRPARNFEDANVLDLNPKKGQNGIYKLVGRLLPYWADPSLSKFTISKTLLTNPLTREKKMIDCPSSANLPSILLTLDIMLRQREKNKLDEEITKEIRKYFMRFTSYYSPMYVYQDPQVPLNNKKIKFFNFGIQFDKMIQEELKEDKLINKAKLNPYDLLAGKDVLISVKFKTKEFRTYEGSKFLPEIGPFRFQKDNGEVHVVTIEELQQMQQNIETPLSALLKAETPNLDPYKYKAWTDKDFTDVAVMLKAIVRYGDLMEELIASGKDMKMVELLKNLAATNHVSFNGVTPQNVGNMLSNANAGMQPAPAPLNTLPFANELSNAVQTPTTAAPAVPVMEMGIPQMPTAPAAPAPAAPAAPAMEMGIPQMPTGAPASAPASIPTTPAPVTAATAPASIPTTPAPVSAAPAAAAPAVDNGGMPGMPFFSEPNEFAKLLETL